jgi:uncharacterized protein DUF4154
MSRPSRKFSILFALVMLWAFLPRLAHSAPDATEEQVKAAFLYQIARYVEWPGSAFPRPDTPVTIAVLGSESLEIELRQLVKGRTAHDRPIVVQQVKSPGSLSGAHVLFVGRDYRSRFGEVAKAQEPGLLFVTDWENALSAGSMVNFIIVDGRVRFEIALDTTLRSGLKPSSRLLAVAQHVHSRGL